MGNRRFRLSNIIPGSFWLSSRKSAASEIPETQVSRPKQPQHCAKSGEGIYKKTLGVHSFDEMLLLSSSSRSFSTERLTLCSETEHTLPPLTLAPLRRPSVYKSSNTDESPRRSKVHTSKFCNGVRLRQKSPRLNGISNPRRSASESSSSSSSGFAKEKTRGLSETSVTVVKSSANPEKDFKESMMEMIVENNISDLDGLKELLVSYLVLNSDEFHGVIVSVFEELVIALFSTLKNRIV